MHDLIPRHTLADRLIHWFNAACWLLLFFTGMALLTDPAPLGRGYSNFVRSIAGGPDALLNFHLVLGFVWAAGFVLYLFVERAGIPVFFQRISRFCREDVIWLLRKPFVMALGEARTKKLGLNPNLPEQDFYNMGQKLFGLVSVGGSLALALTGFVLALAALGMMPVAMSRLVQVCIALHLIAAGLVFLGLMVHVYMAAISPEERPGLLSMFTGTVTGHYARSHHGLWVKELENKDKTL